MSENEIIKVLLYGIIDNKNIELYYTDDHLIEIWEKNHDASLLSYFRLLYGDNVVIKLCDTLERIRKGEIKIELPEVEREEGHYSC